MKDSVIHCWMGKREFLGLDQLLADLPECPHGGHEDLDDQISCSYALMNATCLLEDGHEGEHEWTPDADITITFAPPLGRCVCGAEYWDDRVDCSSCGEGGGVSPIGQAVQL